MHGRCRKLMGRTSSGKSTESQISKRFLLGFYENIIECASFERSEGDFEVLLRVSFCSATSMCIKVGRLCNSDSNLSKNHQLLDLVIPPHHKADHLEHFLTQVTRYL